MASPFPTPDPADQEESEAKKLETRELLNTLMGYYQEAKEARETGPAPRDNTWSSNWNSYWGYYDHGEKAEWQSQSVMPEVPLFVERFTAAITQALVQAGQFYTIEDPTKKMRDIMPLVERFVRVMLDRSSRNQTGHRIGFERPFGDAIKAGCMMMVGVSVTWQDGALLIEPVDARELYFDPSGRGLYRVRKYEIDRYRLDAWAEEEDSEGNPLFHRDAIERVIGTAVQDVEAQVEKERSSGTGQEVKWQRKPVEIKEFLATILDLEGKAVGKRELVVVANDQEIIRGPEPNPYWHGRDWIVATPLITVPFSQYGRTYVESFRQLADAFTELTNLIRDAIFTNSMNAFVGWPSKLLDPKQLDEGVSPNKVFIADEEECANDEMPLKTLPLGDPRAIRDAVAVWQGLKQELREGGMQNELNLGQLPPKGDITATEIIESKEGTNSLTTQIAGNVEDYLLAPVVELAWMTGLQMLDPDDAEISEELGPEITGMLVRQREDFRKRRFRFKAKGISSMIERARRIRNLLSFLQVASSNEILLQQLLEKFSGERILERLMRDFGIDPTELEKTKEEALRDAVAKARSMGLTGEGGGGSPPAPKGLPPGGPT